MIFHKQISSNAYCFDALASRRNVEKPVKANQCHNQGGNQARQQKKRIEKN